MSGRWFRLYDDAVHDPKVQTLSPYLFKFWICFLCLASKSNGIVEKRYIKMVSYRHQDGFNAVSKLISYGLIDEVDGHYEPHNWKKRQWISDTKDPTNAERQQRFRDKKGDRYAVTPKRPDTETDKSSFFLTAAREDKSKRKPNGQAGSLASALPSGALDRQPTREQAKARLAWEREVQQRLPSDDYAKAIDQLADNPKLCERATRDELRKPGSGAMTVMLALQQNGAAPKP